MENDKYKMFGMENNEVYSLSLEEAYDLVKTNTNYLDNTPIEEIKEIKFSFYKDIFILLRNGILKVNGKFETDNVKTLGFSSGRECYYIDTNKSVVNLVNEDMMTEFINNSDYKYKKLLIDALVIIGLTNDGIIKVYATEVCGVINYELFTGVDDLGYNVDMDDYVVVKAGKILSLFRNIDYTDCGDKIVYSSGSYEDYMII